jgi:cell division septation protein DedD
MGSIQEQMSYFSDAVASYAAAAGIAAGDAEDMPKKTNEELVIDAVRCALSAGDYHTADLYLNSAVRNSKSDVIQSYIKLYSQWSSLCKAETPEEIQEPVALLQAYTKVQSMSAVWPSIFLTLWYVTGDNSYAVTLSNKFPNSIEAAIVKGDVQILPSPFWFFVPKSGEAEPESGSYSPSAYETPSSETTVHTEEKSAGSTNEKNLKKTKLQLGLFRTESNAKLLVDELKAKGFSCYITTEKRASGTTYYIVLTEENENNTVADELRSAGYDCYVVD